MSLADPNVEIVSVGDIDTFTVDGEDHGSWLTTGYSHVTNLPIFRHNFESDTVAITARYYEKGYTVEVIGNGSTYQSLGPFPYTGVIYVADANHIRVFMDGVELEKGEIDADPADQKDWQEYYGTGAARSAVIKMHVPTFGKTIQVLYSNATLKEGVHFEHINSNIVRLLDRNYLPTDPTLDFDKTDDFTIWG